MVTMIKLSQNLRSDERAIIQCGNSLNLYDITDTTSILVEKTNE